VHGDRDARRRQNFRQRGDLVLVRMHAAGRHQAHDVGGAAGCLQGGNGIAQHRVGGEAAVGDGGVDARQVLHHHAPGAEVHVADLGVAHLSARQPHLVLGGVDQGVRRGGEEAVQVRRRRLADGVVLAGLAMAPAVEDAEHHGARRIGVGGILGHLGVGASGSFNRGGRGARRGCSRRGTAARPAGPSPTYGARSCGPRKE
jgi:hypothetical protein